MNFSRWSDRSLTALQFTLLWVAPIFLVIAAGLTAYEVYFLHNAVQAQGVVMQMEEMKHTDTDSETVITYSPVFQFRDNSGEHTIHANSGTNPPAFRVGEHIAVLYLPNAPEHAQIASWSEQWDMVVGFGGVALVAAGVGVAMRLVRGPRNFWDYVPCANSANR